MVHFIIRMLLAYPNLIFYGKIHNKNASRLPQSDILCYNTKQERKGIFNAFGEVTNVKKANINSNI